MSSMVDLNNEVNPDASSSSSRKRRRRTVTTGASEDCSACRKRQVRCDRVRPFCGQCLELGKECSGYRTTLTWGVGVASRGKLRGLSLPVLTPIDHSKKNLPQTICAKTSASTSSNAASTPSNSSIDEDQERPSKRRRATAPGCGAGANAEDDATAKFMQPSPVSISPSSWVYHNSNLAPPTPFTQSSQQRILSDSRQRQPRAPPTSAPSHDPVPFQPPSVDTSWHRQTNYTPCSTSLPTFIDPFDSKYNGSPVTTSVNTTTFLSAQSLMSDQFPLGSALDAGSLFMKTNSVDLSSPSDLNSMTYSPLGEDTAYSFSLTPAIAQGGFDVEVKSESLDDEDLELELVPYGASSIPQPLHDMSFFHLPRRMQYLLDFYDKAICPVLVAFDEPSNPYRNHILPLALQNPGLQHAIAALVTNNIRMRNCQHVPWSKQDPERRKMLTAPGFPTQEEQFHKSKSIELLNDELKNSRKASDDSVLATLLVLCLFHVCNSGFSKFKTQLAGVQKLLRMRSKELRSDFIGWVEMFFAWFDVMNSAVNDREIEIKGDSLDMKDFTANLGALEHYSGCDGRLFKIIARLGRLNLLSQGRKVRDEQFQPLASMFTVPTDARGTFWQEWYDVRERLKKWEFGQESYNEDSTYMSVPQRHIVNISEAFRCSALLYIERLAFPQLPSGHKNFQELVKRSMSYIGSIGTNSCMTKFLLWPLFVTGTECVDDEYREMIRERCVEIQQESGFYNNITGLQVLERMWHESDSQRQKLWESNEQAPDGQALWWRTAMDRADGEYIVI